MLFRRKKNYDKERSALHDSPVLEEEPSKLQRFFSVFHFNKHREIERSMFMFGLSFFLLFVGLIWGVFHIHYENVKRDLTVNTSGQQFSFSKTDTNLTIHKVVLSKDGKTAYIPFTLDSMDAVSGNADKLRVFVTCPKQTLTYRPAGRLILFSDTGRGAIEIHSSTGFSTQPIQIYINNRAHFKTADAGGEDENTDVDEDVSNNAVNDQSDLFKKYDFVTFRINPYNKQAQHSKRITSSPKEPMYLYADLFSRHKVNKIKKQIAKHKKNISAYQNGAEELRDKLVRAGYIVPPDPKFMLDTWRPDDEINPNTGCFVKNGKSAINYSVNDVTNHYPETLKRRKGNGTNAAAADNSDNNDNDTDNEWSDLTSTWDEIENLKRDIYVYDMQQLYLLKRDAQNMNNQTSVGSPKNFIAFGKIKVKTK